MNRHFRDARYYVKRAGETAAKGIREELAPIEARIAAMRDGEPEREPGRVEELRTRLTEWRWQAETEVRTLVSDLRDRVGAERTA